MKPLIIILLLVVDAIGSATAVKLTYMIRYQSGMFEIPLPVDFFGPMIALIGFWWLLFALMGMYRTPVAISRFDEIVQSFKVVLVGVFVIFIATFDSEDPVRMTRVFLLMYGGFTFILIGTGRFFVRNYQRWLRQRGIGLANALIIGFNDIGKRLHYQLYNYPVWGFHVVGFIDDVVIESQHHGLGVLGRLEQLNSIIQKHGIRWVLIAPEKFSHDSLLHVFNYCSFSKVRFMIVADYYHMVVGMSRTVQIHGLPLVEVVPQVVSKGVVIFKRTIDIIIGLVGSLIALVILPFIALLIKLSRSSAVFKKEIWVGMGIRPILVTRIKIPEEISKQYIIDKILKKTQLNDLPMIFSVLKGDLSLVGPAPEYEAVVAKRRLDVPLYDRIFRVRPGLTGWTQIREKSGQSPKDIFEKTGYDLFYIDHLTPSLDMKIIATTIWRVFKGDW